MSCKYIYKGHTFNSEIELDDYLLSKYQFEGKFPSDIVFSKTAVQLDSMNKVADLNDKTVAMKDAYNYTRVYDEDGEEVGDRPKPYIGVTKFLSIIKDKNGNYLFPVFIAENYWKEKIKVWTDESLNRDITVPYNPDKNIGVFTKEEVDLIFDGNWDNVRYLSKDEALLWKQIITNKWKQQAEMGTAFHKVMEIFFSKTDDKYNFTQPDEFIKDLALKNTSYQFITPEIIDQTIVFARKLKSFIAKTLNEDEDVLEFYPEVNISGKMSLELNGGLNKLVGNIDIAVVDSKGTTHIFDYKTSPKQYIQYSSAKRLAFKYQQATYARILQRNNINVNNTKICIVPVQFENFKLINKDDALQNTNNAKFTYSGISYDENDMVRDLAPDIRTNKSLKEHLEEYMPKLIIQTAPVDKLLEYVKKRIETACPGFNKLSMSDDEQLRDELKQAGAFTANEEGIYEYRMGNNKITAKSEEDMFKQVKDLQQSYEDRVAERATVLANAIQKGQLDNTTDISDLLGNLITKSTGDDKRDANWFLQYIQQYCNDSWQVDIEPAALRLGIIFIRNVYTNQFDVIQVCSDKLDYLQYYKENGKDVSSRSNLLYGFETDLEEEHNSNSYMLKAYKGNIRLMECMFAINKYAAKFQNGAKVGHIQITNPFTGQAMSAKNEELLYSYKKLAKYAKVQDDEEDYILNGKIEFCDQLDLVQNELTQILSTQEPLYGRADYRSSKTQLESAVNVEDKIEALRKLASALVQKNKSLTDPTASNTSKEARIYNKVLMAIAELSGLHLRQQVKDHDKYVERKNLSVITKGWSGSYVDNPGNLDSNTLNVLTTLVAQGYQAIRTEMTNISADVRKQVKKLKEAEHFNSLGNQASLYIDMFNDKYKDNLVLKNPDDPVESAGLSEAKKEFMRFFLKAINAKRLNKTPEEIEDMRLSGDVRYYEVPLAKGTASSEIAAKGLMGFLKRKLDVLLHPSKMLSEARATLEGIFDPEDAENLTTGTNLFEMNNMFEMSPEQRVKALDTRGKDYFERNLETLLLKHEFAYSAKKQLDYVFPMIKAAFVHLKMQGEFQNNKFTNDEEYAKNYIKAVVKNQPITSSLQQEQTKAVISTVKRATSFMTLAFSPLQLYQYIQHFWVDLSLIIRKPDGTNAFSKKNFFKAFKIVYKELFHYSDTPTKVQLLNELYGVNDMDMNTYVDRIKSDQSGFFNITNFAYKFASRPDYYGRMSIIVAKMLEDGSWDAYSVVDGKLVYDFKKDARFSDIANGRENPKQLALYYTIGKQLINENYTDADGKPFRFSKDKIVPLPVPYSTKEVESLKNITDVVYGYYTHERKSLLHYTFLGTLLMQMRTYWSGKKNQYLQPGGVKVQGSWQQATDNEGNKLYYQVVDGIPREDLPPVKESDTDDASKLVPFLVWKGQWQEGIIVTLSSVAKDLFGNGGKKFGYAETLNVILSNNAQFKTELDPDMLRAYRSNLRQLLYDLILFFVISSGIAGALTGWGDELTKNAKNSGSVTDGLKASSTNIFAKLVHNSAADFAFWDSIGSPLAQWTPFSLETIARQCKNWGNVAMGDNTFWNGVTNTFNATKVFRPALGNIAPFKNEDSE